MTHLAVALEIDGARLPPGGVAPGGDPARPAPRPRPPAPARRGGRAGRVHAGDARRRPAAGGGAGAGRAHRRARAGGVPRRGHQRARPGPGGVDHAHRAVPRLLAARRARPHQPRPGRVGRRQQPRRGGGASLGPSGDHGRRTRCAARRPTASTWRAALWDSWEDDAVDPRRRDQPLPRPRPAALRRLRGRDVLGQGPGHRARGRRRATSSCSRRPELVDPASVDVALVAGRDVAAVAAAADAAHGRRGAGSPRSRSPWTPPGTSGAERRRRTRRARGRGPTGGRLRYVGGADGLVRLLAELAAARRRRPAATRSSSTRTWPCCRQLVIPRAGRRARQHPPDARPVAAQHPRAGAPRQPVRGRSPRRPKAEPMTRTDAHDVPRPDAQLHLGVFFQGVNHWTIWTEPDSGSQIGSESYRQVAQTAERGLFDAFFLGEGLRLREINGRRARPRRRRPPRRASPSSPRSPP